MTDSPSSPRVPKRGKTGQASRFVAAGAAVGVSMVAVGAMAAATNSSEVVPTEPATQRVVVMPQQATPQQIIIVLPDGETQVVSLPGAETAVAPIAIPQDPQPPSTVRAERAPTPVTESGGS